MLRRVGEWVAVLVVGVALGFGIAWTERTFAIPKIVVQWFLIALTFAAIGFALWTGWRYYEALRDEDEWE